MITWHDLRREPFRAFFPLGILFGFVGVGHWLVYGAGWSSTYSGFFHASMQMGVYLFGFVAGFLLTALPRFAAAPPAGSGELAALLGLYLAQPLFLSLGWWAAAELCFAGLLLGLAVFAGRRFASRRGGVGPPTEFVWIPVGLLCGVVGAGLLAAGQLGWGPPALVLLGRPLLQQGVLLCIVLGVGGFMAPRLMGHLAGLGARRIRWHLLAAAALVSSFLIEGQGWMQAAYLLRALVVSAELLWTTRCYRRPAVPDLYVRLVWMSVWMIVAGYWAAALWIAHRIAMLHLVFLGGFSLLVFAVGTMVVFSHSGQGSRLRERLWPLRVVVVGIAAALAARLLADLWPARYFSLLAVASGCWLAAGVSWLVLVLPIALRPTPAGEFERLHEEAKRQFLRQS